jgi:hypothetical protein
VTYIGNRSQADPVAALRSLPGGPALALGTSVESEWSSRGEEPQWIEDDVEWSWPTWQESVVGLGPNFKETK